MIGVRCVLALTLVLAATSPATANDVEPRVLFAEGRYSAAAALFERRWQVSGTTTDGFNAVISWRTAGRYARARALLARVVAKPPSTGALSERTRILEDKLARLTGTVRIEGNVSARATVTVDAGPVERIGDVIVVNVGKRELRIEQQDCQPFLWRGVVHPGEHIPISAALRCDVRGTLHVTLLGDARGTFTVDGSQYQVVDREAELALTPGRHRLIVRRRSRLVADETVVIRSKQTTSRRVSYPWRVRAAGWTLGLSSVVAVSGVGSTVAGGLSMGRSGARYRAHITFGGGTTSADGLEWSKVGNGGFGGRPWFGASGALHLWSRPLAQTRRGRAVLTLDIDPLGARFDQLRTTSYFGLFVPRDEVTISYLGLVPLTLAVDWPGLHLEEIAWPIGLARYKFLDKPEQYRWRSVAVTLTLGLRL